MDEDKITTVANKLVSNGDLLKFLPAVANGLVAYGLTEIVDKVSGGKLNFWNRVLLTTFLVGVLSHQNTQEYRSAQILDHLRAIREIEGNRAKVEPTNVKSRAKKTETEDLPEAG